MGSCIMVSSTLFGRSSALGSIVVQGLSMLRIFFYLSHFLSSALSVSSILPLFLWYMWGWISLSVRAHQGFLLSFALFLLGSCARGFFVLARVCSSCAGVNLVDHRCCWRDIVSHVPLVALFQQSQCDWEFYEFGYFWCCFDDWHVKSRCKLQV